MPRHLCHTQCTHSVIGRNKSLHNNLSPFSINSTSQRNNYSIYSSIMFQPTNPELSSTGLVKHDCFGLILRLKQEMMATLKKNNMHLLWFTLNRVVESQRAQNVHQELWGTVKSESEHIILEALTEARLGNIRCKWAMINVGGMCIIQSSKCL
jgi:hypothetical protein